MNSEKRTDNYSSTMSGLGSTRDKTTDISMSLTDSDLLTDECLSSFYSLNGILASIVDNVPDDGVRNGWTYMNDEPGKIEDYCDQVLNLQNNINYAWKMSRVFGGSIIVMLSDTVTPDKSLGTTEKITRLKVYSRARIRSTNTDIISDPKNKYFDDVEYYKVSTRSGQLIDVHKSRCLVFKGDAVADYGDTAYNDFKYLYWGLSTIQRVWDSVKILGSSMQGIGNIMQELVLGKYTVEGLKNILAQNRRDALEAIMTRLEAMNAAKSTINAVLLGENEKYERDTANFSGVSDVLDRLMMMVSAVAKQPITKIFGRSAAGMNSTGENDMQQYYDSVASYQENTLRYELNKVIGQVGIMVYSGQDKSKYGVEEFNSLWEMDDKQRAEIDKMNAEKWQIYIMNQVIDAQYVQEQEFPEFEGLTFTGQEEEQEPLDE